MPQQPTNIVVQGSSTKPQSQPTKPTAFAREVTGDPQLDRAQENARRAFTPTASLPFAKGNLFRDQTFVANTPLVIAHGLGSAARYAVFNMSAAARFSLVANSPTSLDAKQIQVQADANCTADVWVYL